MAMSPQASKGLLSSKKNPSTFQREHPGLQKTLKFFFLVIFDFLVPNFEPSLDTKTQFNLGVRSLSVSFFIEKEPHSS